jgi:TolA-binding protein
MQRVRDIQSGNFSSIPDPEFTQPETPAAAPIHSAEVSVFDSPAPDAPSDMVDFDFDDDASPSRVAPGMHTELSSEMDSFLQSDDDFSLGGSNAPKSASALLTEGKDYQQAGKHQEAINSFTMIVNDAAPSDPVESDAWEEAHVQIGISLYNLGKLKESLNDLTIFMKNYPQSKHVKNALLYAGYVFEKAGSKDKAVPYYKKVMTMPPRDELTSWAMTRLKSLGV